MKKKKLQLTEKKDTVSATVPQPEFLTVEEVANLLRVTKMTVYRTIDRGEIPYYRLGRLKRFRRSDVEDYLTRCRVPHDQVEK